MATACKGWSRASPIIFWMSADDTRWQDEGAWEWRQPDVKKRRYELVAGNTVKASLAFRSILGTMAECRVDGSEYTFKRTGFLHPKVTVRRSPYDQDIASMDLSWRGEGALEMLNGGRYTLRRLSFWGVRWGIMDDQGDLLASVHMKPKLLRYEGEVQLEERSGREKEMALLLSLLWYIAVLISQESTAAAASS